MNLMARSNQLLNLKTYAVANPGPVPVLPLNNIWQLRKTPSSDIRILRMLVDAPFTGLQVPPELEWLKDEIVLLKKYLNKYFPDCYLPYTYVTVRKGRALDTTDTLWHVDGFSARYAHIPDQNFIWADYRPTEYYNRSVEIPISFNPRKHNIHTYFQEMCTDASNVVSCNPDTWYQLDPYVIHRRPPESQHTYRLFIRVSFLALPIEDDRNTPNPLIRVPKFNRNDIRDSLVSWHEDRLRAHLTI